MRGLPFSIFSADGPALHGRYVHAQQLSPACSPIMQATRTCTRVRQMVADGIGCETERGAGERAQSQRRIDDHKPLPRQRPRRCTRCCCHCHARWCRAACPEGQWPPAGGRNGSRIAMCRAHSHAVPHTRTVEHDQHWQRSLRWMRKALQNDEPKIGLFEPRLRFLQAEAMQAMQVAAMLRSAPHRSRR